MTMRGPIIPEFSSENCHFTVEKVQLYDALSTGAQLTTLFCSKYSVVLIDLA